MKKRIISYTDAINEALVSEMKKNKKILSFGLGINDPKKIFNSTKNLEKLFGKNRVLTNTLHGQGVMKPGKRVIIDGYAHDGTPEALYIADAPGFTLSVQWHPEYCASQDPVSKPLFEAFGKATRDFHSYRNS